MKQANVVIAGGGPTGMMLAAELALANVAVVIVERRLTQDVAGSRAGGLHSRALEELDQRGVVERFVAQGTKHYAVPFPGVMLDRTDTPTRHNYSLGLFQEKIERTLADWLGELGVEILRGEEVVSFEQDETGVDVALKSGRTLRAQYLVGCDGGRSIIRKQAGIAFPGWDASLSYLIYEGEMTEAPPFGIRHSARGIIAAGPIDEGKRVRGVVTENELKRGDEPSVEDLREAFVQAYGTDFGVHSVTWLSRFTDAARQAASYRNGRVLLAGDSAHVHSPTGGQGLNIGLQDAVNLGWKLAQVANGVSPDTLLDTYQAERHPVGADVIEHTLAITALSRGDDRTEALRKMLPHVMQMEGPRKWFAAKMTGLGVRYDLGEGHPLLGRRMPDLDIVTAAGPTRVFALLHDARAVVLSFGATLDIAPWRDRVKLVDAQYEGAWELPVIDEGEAPRAVLIRPDGYVAWVSASDETGLAEALTLWCGPPA